MFERLGFKMWVAVEEKLAKKAMLSRSILKDQSRKVAY